LVDGTTEVLGVGYDDSNDTTADSENVGNDATTQTLTKSMSTGEPRDTLNATATAIEEFSDNYVPNVADNVTALTDNAGRLASGVGEYMPDV
jgi:X-X-X-Leu-X-X-Gly heptad repeat protein